MQKQGSIMSRRKQSNPKPLLKNECHELKSEPIEQEANLDDLDEDLENFDESNAQFSSSTPSPSNTVENKERRLSQSPGSIQNESQSPALPKLRLNPSLASDPALKADAVSLVALVAEEKPSDDLSKCDSDSESVKKINSEIVGRFKVFTCQPCGIGFSSLSTLEAHQNFYCSHRKENEEEISSTNILVENPGESSSKAIKTGRQYACTQCNYSADKKVSLNRHMRMHQSSPLSNTSISNGDENSSQQIDRYCSDCDIHFSNVKTYRAHKQHYCRSRRVEGQTPTRNCPKSPQGPPKTPSPHLQPFLALPTSPILIIPYSLIKTATIISGSVPPLSTGGANSSHTCYAYENGSMRPIATATIKEAKELNHRVIDSSRPKVDSEELTQAMGGGTSSNSIRSKDLPLCTNEQITVREFTPLDLSLRKSPCTDAHTSFSVDVAAIGELSESRLLSNSGKVSPEHIVCAPSLPNSPPTSPVSLGKLTTSPQSVNLIAAGRSSSPILSGEILNKINESQRNIELIPKSACKTASKSNDSHTLFNFPINVVPSMVNITPQIYVKQGVSKCKECNIVFCKYENYLAHKQHYCSARNQETVDGGGGENHVTTKDDNNDTDHPPVAYQQLICAACGIKYTSLDNLRAHQSFYCPKGSDLAANQTTPNKENCSKCNTSHEPGRCTFTQTTYKCPVCDVVSVNAAESRKHLEKHGSVKAFRCSICGYKGNTLRGMRTHIRMHFDKRTSDFSEENYMTCIVEDDTDEPMQTEPINPEILQQPSFSSASFSYASTFKGNTSKQNKSAEPSQNPRASSDIEDVEIVPKREVIYESNDRSAIINEPTETKISNDSSDGMQDVKEEIGTTTTDTKKNTLSSTPPLASEENISPLKYCQTCDIKFKYLNSYIAHKKFYCKSSKNESQEISQILPPSSNNKNKENFESVS